MIKNYTVVKCIGERELFFIGTIDELVPKFAYTLSLGVAYQNERGNKKVNISPKTAKSLITNLNISVRNMGTNVYYYLQE